jgi:exodeoxyribonuclease-3
LYLTEIVIYKLMKIGCWNVAGIRACLKKNALDWILKGGYDVFCFQETKAEEYQVQIPSSLQDTFPYRLWNSCKGEGGQRRGLSGTAIWSKVEPLREISPPAEDKEGRVTAVEFADFNLVTVYTPNSQSVTSERLIYRVNEWDVCFRLYIRQLNSIKPTIICGDFNVARRDIDVYEPEEMRNVSPGFLNVERAGLEMLLAEGFMDAYRWLHPLNKGAFTYWDQKMPYLRRTNRGWRIDYFFVADNLVDNIKKCRHHKNILGSDHCPLTLVIKNPKRKLKIVDKIM